MSLILEIGLRASTGKRERTHTPGSTLAHAHTEAAHLPCLTGPSAQAGAAKTGRGQAGLMRAWELRVAVAHAQPVSASGECSPIVFQTWNRESGDNCYGQKSWQSFASMGFPQPALEVVCFVSGQTWRRFLAPLLVKGREFLPFWLKNNVLLESFVYFFRKLCMLASLKTFVCIFWCVYKFCCKHRAETEMILDIFAVSAANNSQSPPTTAVATFMSMTSECISELWSLDLG